VSSTRAYGPLLFDVTSVPFPADGHEQATLDALEVACRKENPAAFVVEPLILGAGGMLMYPAWVLQEMKRICEASDVLFIADEVMTSWGRTGTLFACEQANVSPDMACYSKGLTGGSLPLAVTLCRADIFDAHYSTIVARLGGRMDSIIWRGRARPAPGRDCHNRAMAELCDCRGRDNKAEPTRAQGTAP
jgi:adenosylmethionine-8-amino-7-oxononanoate aminotransferase